MFVLTLSGISITIDNSMKACFSNNIYTMSIQKRTIQIENSRFLIKHPYKYDFKTLLVYKINYLSLFVTALTLILTCNSLLHIKTELKVICT